MSKLNKQILVKAGGSGVDKVGQNRPKIVLKKDKVQIQKKEERKREEERKRKEEEASKVYTFEEKLRGYAFRRKGKVNTRINLVEKGQAFMSAEEVYSMYPNLSYDLVMEVWRTFHGATTGIPISFIEKFEPHYQKQRKDLDPEVEA